MLFMCVVYGYYVSLFLVVGSPFFLCILVITAWSVFLLVWFGCMFFWFMMHELIDLIVLASSLARSSDVVLLLAFATLCLVLLCVCVLICLLLLCYVLRVAYFFVLFG